MQLGGIFFSMLAHGYQVLSKRQGLPISATRNGKFPWHKMVASLPIFPPWA